MYQEESLLGKRSQPESTAADQVEDPSKRQKTLEEPGDSIEQDLLNRDSEAPRWSASQGGQTQEDQPM